MEKRKDKNRIVLRKGEGQRPNGTYWYRWCDIDGKRHAVYAKTLSQLRQKEQYCQEVVPVEKSINEIYEEWISKRRDLKVTTIRAYNYVYNKWIKNTLGNKLVTNVSRRDIKNFFNSIADNNDMSASTINSINAILYQLFFVALDSEIIDVNPCDGIMKTVIKRFRSKKKVNALSEKQETEFLTFVKNSKYSKWYPLFITLADTGMRIGQALGLTWNDVNFEDRYISVNRTLYYINGHIGFQSPKTEESVRNIPMTQRVIDVLSELKSKAVNEIVFSSKKNNNLRPTNVDKALEHIINSYNSSHQDFQLPHISSHMFRHTFATKLNNAGVNIKYSQRILGHSNIHTTMDIYTDVSPQILIKEVQKLTPQNASSCT